MPRTMTPAEADARKLRNLEGDQLEQALRDREQQRVTAQMAVDEATEQRNAAVAELSRRGVRNGAIATLLGCSATRVTQILARAQREVTA